MNIKLIQKHFFKGTREFEIVNDTVYVRIKGLFKEEKLTVGLSILNPESVVNKPYLDFYSHAKSEPLLSLFLNKPDAEQFNAFVDTLTQQVFEASNISAQINAGAEAAGLAANVYHEAPEFEEPEQRRLRKKKPAVDAEKIDYSIQMLEKYLASEDIKFLLSALKALKEEPESEACFTQMESAFNDLGIMQGAVLTYAPYISILLADDPFAMS